jgi:hypothetical protein
VPGSGASSIQPRSATLTADDAPDTPYYGMQHVPLGHLTLRDALPKFREGMLVTLRCLPPPDPDTPEEFYKHERFGPAR